MVYLDNAATTIPDDAVLEIIKQELSESYANPSALYSEGLKARKTIEQARGTIAGVFGCDSQELYFTATGTEANNIAVLGAARARANFGNEIIITGYEHSSIYATALSLKEEGFTVHTVDPAHCGKVETNDILSKVNSRTALVAVMQVNNETGAVINVGDLSGRVKEINQRTAFHSDMVQGFMKYPVNLKQCGIDTAAISAHKIHGPKGIGALFVRKGFNIKPVIFGGGQERGLRSGTENAAYAAAFAKAAVVFDTKESFSQAESLNSYARDKLSLIDGVIINSPEDASVFILNISLPGYRSETLLRFLDDEGIMVSSGSTCSKGAASHTLVSMGLDTDRVDSSIRISFSKNNKKEDIDLLRELLERAKKRLIHKNDKRQAVS